MEENRPLHRSHRHPSQSIVLKAGARDVPPPASLKNARHQGRRCETFEPGVVGTDTEFREAMC